MIPITSFFTGGSRGIVSISNDAINVPGGPASYVLNSDGTGEGSSPFNWLTPQADSLGWRFDARATLLGGDAGAGFYDQWLNLSETRFWTLTALASPQINEMLIEIRDALTQEVLDSAQISRSSA